MNVKELKNLINNGAYDQKFTNLYDENSLDFQKNRYITAIENFEELYGENGDVNIYSVSGRSELAGNHTDHNHGKVVAASINLDIIAIVAKNGTTKINLKSEGFNRISVDFAEYKTPQEKHFGTSASLIAGMCEGFEKSGFEVGGFDAYCTSSVLRGSGLSSSAAFEVMIGNILNHA